MTISEMHTRFKLRMDKADSLNNPSFEPEEIDMYLNIAQDRIIKTRYSGNNPHRESLEEDQKRIEDLKMIIKRLRLSATSSSKNKKYGAFFNLPFDHFVTIQEELIAKVKDCNEIESEKTIDKVKAISHNKYSTLASNSFWKSNNQQVLRLVYRDNIEIIGTAEVTPLYLDITYLKHPVQMSLTSSIDCELSQHLHDEIVVEAVGLAMGAITDNRVELNNREQISQE